MSGRYVGIDLAWKVTKQSRTGIAAVDDAGRLVASGVVRTDDEIADWIARHAPQPLVVTVDAPLVVPNDDGQRLAENLIGRAYGRYGASAYSASRKFAWFDPPRADTLAQRFGWEIDPGRAVQDGATLCLEVYPHPALVGIFALPQRILYKKGPDRQAGFRQLLELIGSIGVLQLGTSSRWQELTRIVEDPKPGDLTRIEDEIDAILCAHLAWLWHHRRDSLAVFGTVEEGYIVAPPTPTHPPLLVRSARRSRRSGASPGSCSVDVPAVQPGTTATQRGARWRGAVATAVAGREVFAPGERLHLEVDFVVPQRISTHDEWDLDNLLKPTIDGLRSVLGDRRVASSHPQADDERIDKITATKRAARPGESLGARLVLRVL